MVLRAGVYEFADNMCLGISLYSVKVLGDSALCINRNVTIEAEVAGSVVLDAKGIGRVITVLSGAEAKLVGLNITGGAVVGRRQYIAMRKNEQWAIDTATDWTLQGGGLFVQQGGTADLGECNIFDNTAKEVCSQKAHSWIFCAHAALVDRVPLALPWQGVASVRF